MFSRRERAQPARERMRAKERERGREREREGGRERERERDQYRGGVSGERDPRDERDMIDGPGGGTHLVPCERNW